jgi:hypothetical protein
VLVLVLTAIVEEGTLIGGSELLNARRVCISTCCSGCSCVQDMRADDQNTTRRHVYGVMHPLQKEEYENKFGKKGQEGTDRRVDIEKRYVQLMSPKHVVRMYIVCRRG